MGCWGVSAKNWKCSRAPATSSRAAEKRTRRAHCPPAKRSCSGRPASVRASRNRPQVLRPEVDLDLGAGDRLAGPFDPDNPGHAEGTFFLLGAAWACGGGFCRGGCGPGEGWAGIATSAGPPAYSSDQPQEHHEFRTHSAEPGTWRKTSPARAAAGPSPAASPSSSSTAARPGPYACFNETETIAAPLRESADRSRPRRQPAAPAGLSSAPRPHQPALDRSGPGSRVARRPARKSSLRGSRGSAAAGTSPAAVRVPRRVPSRTRSVFLDAEVRGHADLLLGRSAGGRRPWPWPRPGRRRRRASPPPPRTGGSNGPSARTRKVAWKASSASSGSPSGYDRRAGPSGHGARPGPRRPPRPDAARIGPAVVRPSALRPSRPETGRGAVSDGGRWSARHASAPRLPVALSRKYHGRQRVA